MKLNFIPKISKDFSPRTRKVQLLSLQPSHMIFPNIFFCQKMFEIKKVFGALNMLAAKITLAKMKNQKNTDFKRTNAMYVNLK